MLVNYMFKLSSGARGISCCAKCLPSKPDNLSSELLNSGKKADAGVYICDPCIPMVLMDVEVGELP